MAGLLPSSGRVGGTGYRGRSYVFFFFADVLLDPCSYGFLMRSALAGLTEDLQ